MFSLAEELKGVLKEKYQQEYEQYMAEEAKKVQTFSPKCQPSPPPGLGGGDGCTDISDL